MKVSLSTNTSASLANRSLSKTDIAVRQSINRLSTGRRINNSTDDSGGLSVSYALRNKLSKNREISTSISNSLSFLQVQEGALRSVGSILSRMTELKTMSLDVTKNGNDLEAYNKEFKELQLELGHISKYKFNGISIFSDQIPKILFGEAQGLEIMKQVTDDENFSQTANITRWGIYRNFSVSLEGEDDFPDKYGEDPPRDLIAFAISDESTGGRSYNNPFNKQTGIDLFESNLDEWEDFVGEDNVNLDAKIALIRVEEGSYGKQLLPDGYQLPSFVNLFEELKRDGGAVDNSTLVDAGFERLKSAFLEMTNNGTSTPKGIGVFVDNTGSVVYNEVDGPTQKFMSWVRDNYPDVAVHPVTKNGGSWVDGVYKIASEEWIKQSLLAIKDLINDPEFPVNEGTLDDDKTGIKSLFDSTYDLDEFDMSEFQGFLEKLSTAMGTNGAETEAIKQRLKDLQNTYHSSELAHAKVDSVDIAKESTKFAKRSVLLQATASILLQANQINDVALSLLS
jgi:flagellin-like hook-associated protein FlgL